MLSLKVKLNLSSQRQILYGLSESFFGAAERIANFVTFVINFGASLNSIFF